jgi:hypothetical protein
VLKEFIRQANLSKRCVNLSGSHVLAHTGADPADFDTVLNCHNQSVLR